MPRKPAPDVLSLFDTLVYTCQYRLVIEPASTALARILEWRQALRERIGPFEGAYQMPGLPLLGAELPPEYEGPLGDAIARGCEGLPAFTLTIQGLAHSDDKRAIFLEVQEKEAVAALRQRIADHVRTNRRIKKLGVDVHERPLLPIAGGLKPDQFTAAWTMLSPFGFTARQLVSGTALLKRELNDTALDEHVRSFPLPPAH